MTAPAVQPPPRSAVISASGRYRYQFARPGSFARHVTQPIRILSVEDHPARFCPQQVLALGEHPLTIVRTTPVFPYHRIDREPHIDRIDGGTGSRPAAISTASDATATIVVRTENRTLGRMVGASERRRTLPAGLPDRASWVE